MGKNAARRLLANTTNLQERETFFKSKGIDADVDTFDWDELRRNTQEIEMLQKQAVDRYWQQRGGNPNEQNARYPRR